MRKSLFLKIPMVLAGLAFVNTAAWGTSKTALITVSIGDTLTGAINNMAAGGLSLSTDYAGTISIKWREIEQIKSRYLCEVRLDELEKALRPLCCRGYRRSAHFSATKARRWGAKSDIRRGH